MRTEKVILAKIYIQDNKLGFEWTRDGNKQEVLYFLESFLKVEREYYEEGFRAVEFEDRRGLE